LSAEVSRLNVNINADIKNFQRNMDAVTKKISNVSKDMQKFGKNMTKFVTVPIAGMVTGMAKSAMDLEATEAKYNTVFQGMTDQADDFIRSFQKLTPATTAEARSMASGIQDLLVPMGFMRDEATDLTGEFMHVAGALTNFNSATHSAEDVTSAIQSAIMGQYRSLQSLGIQLDATTAKQKAVEMGLVEQGEEVTKQILAQVVLAETYNQSGDALEAYTEENLDAKTKFALAKAEIIDQAAAIGNNLLPMINQAIDFVRRLTDRFAGLTEGQQQTILKVMGLVAAIGPAIMIIGKLIGVVGALMSPIGLVIAGIALLTAGVVHLWNTNDEFKDAVTQIWENIKENISKSLEAIKAFWEEHGEAIVASIKEVWGFISNIIEGALTVIQGVIQVATGLISGNWDLVWEGMGNTVKGAANVMIGIINGIIRAVEGMVNAVARGVNAIPSFTIPDWVPIIGGKTFGLPNIGRISLPKIPSFDTGGIVPGTGPQLIMAHGGETILPTHKDPTLGNDVTINIYNPSVRNDNDIKEISRQMREEYLRTLRGQGK